MSFNRFDYIVRNFVSDDINKPALQVPYRIGEYIYASDGHTLIKMPSDLCIGQYEEATRQTPDFTKFFISDWGFDRSFTYDQLLPCFESIRIAIKRGVKKCTACNGQASKICPECKHEENCKECKGQGEILVSPQLLVRTVDFENTSGDQIYTVEVGKGLYDPVQLEMICLAMMIVGAFDCKLSHVGTSKSLFEFAGISIVLMQRSRS